MFRNTTLKAVRIIPITGTRGFIKFAPRKNNATNVAINSDGLNASRFG